MVRRADTTAPRALCVSPPQISVGTLFLSPKVPSPSAHCVFSSFQALQRPDRSRSRDNLSLVTIHPHLGVVPTHLFLSLERPDHDHKREERNFGPGVLLRLAESRFATVSGGNNQMGAILGPRIKKNNTTKPCGSPLKPRQDFQCWCLPLFLVPPA